MRGLCPLTGDAAISSEQLMAFSREFRDDYKTFNTTETDAFQKWQASLGPSAWSVRTDYLAQVRNLSMRVPEWQFGEQGAVDGLYGPGCWQVQHVAFQSISPDMQIAGPFTSLHANPPRFYLCLTNLDPISESDKKRLSLA